MDIVATGIDGIALVVEQDITADNARVFVSRVCIQKAYKPMPVHCQIWIQDNYQSPLAR
jgi:hypothetical protein